LLVLASVAVTVAKRRLKETFTTVPQRMRLHWRAMWMFLLVFTLACMLSQLTISIRHFSVPLALLILMLAPLPKTIIALRARWPVARFAGWATAALALVSAIVAVWVYPNYFPYLSAFGLGKPGYEVMNDSNLDWNHALPEVERFAEQRGLAHVLVDEYGFSKPDVYVRGAQFWNCQEPSDADAGQWAVVSAGMIKDGHNCPWLLKYPYDTLADGSMYAFHLPQTIPVPGTPGGPPPPGEHRNWGGVPLKGDVRLMFLNCINDPAQLQPTFDRIVAEAKAIAEKQEKKSR
jgi:hypothetical protein